MNEPPSALILTVGTGTAGRHSNLAAGLRRTVDLLAPARFWLIPSTDVVSILTADLVREGLATFQAWSSAQAYRCIPEPDSLECCRQVTREVIAAVRTTLPKGAKLLLNPTSGTKQMSVGAALAALDEGLGELVFTVGERADGVVKTGTEKIESFDAGSYFAERDLGTARKLFAAGAFAAAATVLERHDSLAAQADIARCCHEWERQNYAECRRIAAASQAAALVGLRHHFETLSLAAKSPQPRSPVVADLLQTAGMFLRRGDFEATLATACRALEMGLRLALFRATGLHEPYDLAKVCSLRITDEIKGRCRAVSNDGQRTILNLNTVARILRELSQPLGATFLNDRDLQALVRVRNDLMHQLRAVTAAEAQAAVGRVTNLLLPLSLPRSPARPGATAW